MKIRDERGFTLVELLVVIAIIGILAVVAVPSLLKNVNKAKVSELKTDISAFELALKSFYLDNDRLPCTKPEHGEVDLEQFLENIDSTDSYTSPFGEEYHFYCIHRDDSKNKEVTRLDVGGFNITEDLKAMIEKDEFFNRPGLVTVSFPEYENKITLWVSIRYFE